MGEGAYFQHLVDTHSKEDMAKALYRIMAPTRFVLYRSQGVSREESFFIL